MPTSVSRASRAVQPSATKERAATPAPVKRERPTLEPWAYTVEEAAVLAGVSERTMWSWVRDERVHVVRIAGITRIGAASLRKLLGLSS